ncbi:MAG: hypothetical protein KC620_12720, partial [Myxococcales bacterium]|nr:hypothetical protein [Myxococcales bacterium]
ARCAAAQAPPPVAVVATPPPPPPPPPPSHALAWTLTGGALALAAGGTALVALSLQDEAQADRAYNHYQAAETAEEAERFAAEVRDAEDAAIPKNVGGLTLLGAGVALGALAVWAWTRDPGDEVALHVGPAVAGAGWRW